jgi:hypothetical protein
MGCWDDEPNVAPESKERRFLTIANYMKNKDVETQYGGCGEDDVINVYRDEMDEDEVRNDFEFLYGLFTELLVERNKLKKSLDAAKSALA